MARLSLTQLKKRYEGKQVLHGVDVEIADGQFVVIVGPSGCGKSTLLRMIAGLEDVTEGTIAIDGREIDHLDPADRGCAMVFQNYALYPHMTVRENIAYPLKIARLPKSERERRVVEAAGTLDLSDYLDRRPAQLSGGQRQRVAMGRAIVREPAVFLFDEPLSNLDAKLRVTMRIEIKRLHKRLNATSIFVTHDQVEAMTLADMLIVMNSGMVEQIGTPNAIYREPASTFVAGFLGAPAMNLLPATAVGHDRVAFDAAPTHLVPAAALNLAVGTKLTLGIRPEDVVVSSDPKCGGLAASIDLIEELGSSRIAYCAVGTEEVAVVLPRNEMNLDHRTIFLDFPANALHAFDQRTGKRLASSPPIVDECRETLVACFNSDVV
ncbi:sn-glycerol-3-phosphate ABC transporter ATP-binding protein UgpC [Microvirga brassicacearum]|uniref:sn-glycerol-3-phosphate ABC transporter ATP-binding protein UgpC n=1 Tax=Microvirga brassicacearum TaxID=2580413 RepID=A0A5N3PE63_9HYPH|nr:sn-glycerol-3-phosphate ABC transporter ATP-binding protein UgpC [Microvirga brassicacearum]KAB0268028.1 sn-glycerol-3-phosphate ABC transporter ATP-binding protein UgpC [Microvirga brassicacearum]